MTAPALAIRADGGHGVGAGHVMRCAALADAWRRAGGRIEWFCRPLPPMLRALLERRGIVPRTVTDDWADIEQWCRDHRGAWACVDGYGFADGPPRLRAAGARVLVIDDDARWGWYDCDAVLNQVIGAEQIHYDVPPGTPRLLGSAYCLLRDEIAAGGQPHGDPAAEVRRVFVSFGGHDAHRQGARVAGIVTRALDRAHVDVAAGVMEDAALVPAARVTVHAGTDLGGVMRQADLAVAAAGSVCWELAYLGIPSVLLVVADNQERVAHGLDAAGIARSLGWFDRVSDAALADAIRACAGAAVRGVMSRNGRQLIDGHGGDRIVQALLAPAGAGAH
jgi:spore coat polysaccharide biosynthesis predicted glycosyltransferase SpsG